MYNKSNILMEFVKKMTERNNIVLQYYKLLFKCNSKSELVEIKSDSNFIKLLSPIIKYIPEEFVEIIFVKTLLCHKDKKISSVINEFVQILQEINKKPGLEKLQKKYSFEFSDIKKQSTIDKKDFNCLSENYVQLFDQKKTEFLKYEQIIRFYNAKNCNEIFENYSYCLRCNDLMFLGVLDVDFKKEELYGHVVNGLFMLFARNECLQQFSEVSKRYVSLNGITNQFQQKIVQFEGRQEILDQLSKFVEHVIEYKDIFKIAALAICAGDDSLFEKSKARLNCLFINKQLKFGCSADQYSEMFLDIFSNIPANDSVFLKFAELMFITGFHPVSRNTILEIIFPQFEPSCQQLEITPSRYFNVLLSAIFSNNGEPQIDFSNQKDSLFMEQFIQMEGMDKSNLICIRDFIKECLQNKIKELQKYKGLVLEQIESGLEFTASFRQGPSGQISCEPKFERSLYNHEIKINGFKEEILYVDKKISLMQNVFDSSLKEFDSTIAEKHFIDEMLSFRKILFNCEERINKLQQMPQQFEQMPQQMFQQIEQIPQQKIKVFQFDHQCSCQQLPVNKQEQKNDGGFVFKLKKQDDKESAQDYM